MEVNSHDEYVKERSSQGFLNLVFGDETELDRSDFVAVVMSKRCNWIFDELAIKNRLEIQMTIQR